MSGGAAEKTDEAAFDSRFVQAAKWCLARGVRPNHLTFLQIPVFTAQIWAATHGHSWLFFWLIIGVIILDGGDGILARVGGMQTRTGAILDSTFDTLGIAIVLWGGSLFFPALQTWMFLLFLGNSLIYLQNALLGQKMVSYVRGPILMAIAVPDVLPLSMFAASFIVLWILVMRMRATWKALSKLDALQ